jgi:hypothetical protein
MTVNTPRPDREMPRCPVESGERCRRLVNAHRSPAERLPWLYLVERCVAADVRKTGLHLDRCEIRAAIALHDALRRLDR